MHEWKTFDWIKLPFAEFEVIEGKIRQYNIDGEMLPSMTSILSVLDDGGIDKWKKRVGEEEANRIVKESTDRGNNLHHLSEQYLMNNLKREDVSGPGAILFNRTRPILNTLGPIVGIEVPLYSKRLKYAGRVDCIAFENKKLCIVDHKNSRKTMDLKQSYVKRKLFKYMLQIVGYSIAFKEMFPQLPMPECGKLIFGELELMRAREYNFEILPLVKEFEILIDIYYNGRNIKDSYYFKL